MEISYTYTPPDREVLNSFELEHKEAIRWDIEYKETFLTQSNTIALWMLQDGVYIGELLFHDLCDNVVEGDSFTILKEYQGKGYGRKLLSEGLDILRFKYTWLIGHARTGTSWNIYQIFGAEAIFPFYNWGGTGEIYFFYKLNLQNAK